MNRDLEGELRASAPVATLCLDAEAEAALGCLERERRWLEATPPPTAPGAYLLVLGREGDTARWEALSGRERVLGRDPGADLVLDSKRVSRRHAVLTFDGADWCLRDAGSANGIRVNGKPRQVAWLGSGDLLEFGDVRLFFLQVQDLPPDEGE